MNAQRPVASHILRSAPTSSARSHLLLLVILLLGAFLRFYRLDAQSLWNDEGNSARLAERPLGLIVEGAAGDIHPPGYYLLLHYWRAPFGQSEFALRSFSVVAGLALLLFTYLLGRRLFGESTGLMAALASAISPFAVYYSQEARMYALLAALAAGSTYFAICLQESAFYERRSAVGNARSAALVLQFAAYGLLTTAGLYTHYVFAFVLLAHNVVFALWWGIARCRSRPSWSALIAWGGVQASALLLYLPWLPLALGATGWSAPGPAYRLGPALLDLLRVLTVGITLPVDQSTLALLLAGVLLLVGMWPTAAGSARASGCDPSIGVVRKDRLIYRRRGLALASLILYLVLPVVLFLALDLYKPAWLKFLVVALSPFHILIALGIESLSTRIPWAPHSVPYASRLLQSGAQAFLLLALTCVTYPSLRNLYVNPAYARDDYRQLVADIQVSRRPGDAIILNAPNQWEVFTYYHADEHVYPAPYRPSVGKVDAFLRPILADHERLFVLYWGDAESDPRKRIESWLAQHAYKAGDRWYGDVRLATYGVASQPGEGDVHFDTLFGEDMRLRGVALEERDPASGDILPVKLFWQAEHAIDQSYKITLQLLDGDRDLVAQVDTVPWDGLAPTTSWQPGDVMVDRYGVPLPPDFPPGRYRLIVAVYHAATGERLPVVFEGRRTADHLPLAEVAVAPDD
jgi:4-amino-4-deoxy-L-arabinose transferase-like glycosyltransferase